MLSSFYQNPAHFRCGFDIVLPWHEETGYGNQIIPKTFHHWFKGGSVVRINDPVMDVDWLGFLFYVKFELSFHPELFCSSHQSPSSSLPHPF
jgi:hypothetical protein